MRTDYSAALVLNRLRVQNANLISSPLTWGFPAPSAFTGFVHTLERSLGGRGLHFPGVGIVCHDVEPQTSGGAFTQALRLTRNPLDHTGGSPAIVEEGRAHLTVSLVLPVAGEGAPVTETQAQTLAIEVANLVLSRRLAGGSIWPEEGTGSLRATGHVWTDAAAGWRKIRRRLLPGFALIERSALLARHTAALKADHSAHTALDALMDLIALHYTPASSNPEEKAPWPSPSRREKGWLVPIPAGYTAISELYPPGGVKNARDPGVPFRFVESVLTLGEWRSPHRLPDLDALLWRHEADPDHGLYRVRNAYVPETLETAVSLDD
jgi:CRISPR-associated protein Csy2